MIVKGNKAFHTCGLLDRVEQRLLQSESKSSDESYETHFESEEEFSKTASPSLKEHYDHEDLRSTRSIDLENSSSVSESIDRTDEIGMEKLLYDCYRGKVLLTRPFPFRHHCTGLTRHDIENSTNSMQLVYHVPSDGYYYYIVYSDNYNEVQFVLDFYKSTYEYSEYTSGCLNKSQCNFPLSFTSREEVVVEIPIRNGIEHDLDDTFVLVSSCQPRKFVYLIFVSTVFIVIFVFALV